MKDYNDFIVDGDPYDGFFTIDCMKCKEYVKIDDGYGGKSYGIGAMSVADIIKLIEEHSCNEKG